MIDPKNLSPGILRAQQRPPALRSPPIAWKQTVYTLQCQHCSKLFQGEDAKETQCPACAIRLAGAAEMASAAHQSPASAFSAHPEPSTASALCGVKFGPLVIGEKRKSKTTHENHPHGKISDSQPQCDQAPALGAASEGEAQGVGRTVVRFIGYRVRPLDPDNFAASVKDLLDGLRHAHCIAGDEPWRIVLETTQIRVGSFKEEKTVIEVI